MTQSHIYLLFTNTGTLFTRMVGLYTKAKYNHVSLALNLSFDETYSFGRKYDYNPFLGGFVTQELQHKLIQTSDCSVYAFAITSRQNKKLREILSLFKCKKDAYSYNIIGLFGVVLNKPIHRKDAYFCSQFIAHLLIEAEIFAFNKPAELVTPQDIQKIPELIPVYQGKLQEMN